MKLLRNIIRTVKRVDRATGRIRDGVIKVAVRLVKAYRKRNGQKVKAHKRVIGGSRGKYAARRDRIAADLAARGKPVVRHKRA